MKAWKKLGIFAIVAVVTAGFSPVATAQQANSTNYGVDQAYFGSGAELEMTSNSYKASGGAGDSAAGDVKGTQYGGNAGSFTTSEPLLELDVQGLNIDHGILSPSATTYGSATIDVRTYNGSGYNMQMTGTAPSQSVYTIPGLAVPTTSQTNVEQFGINLRDNSTPDVGTDPVQIPDSSFSFGTPAPDYNTANLYKYVDGDIIAQSTSATGRTRFTLSYIINVKTLTPAGKYQAQVSIVVSAKF
jgi:hypothetical protein